MKTGYSKQIQERINGADDGTIFVNSDFADIADSETTRRNLNRLTQIGMLRRILKGVYEKPKPLQQMDTSFQISECIHHCVKRRNITIEHTWHVPPTPICPCSCVTM